MKKTLSFYNTNSIELSKRYESADVSEVQNLLIKTFTKKSKLLEIGCGSGRDASFMTRNDFDVTAIDGSKNMIEEAKKIHPELSEKLYNKTLPNDLEFNQIFDGIYSISTLMHLTKIDLEKAISKIHSLLKKNGKFLMSVSLFRDDIDQNGFDDKGRFFLVLCFEEWIKMGVLEILCQSDRIYSKGLNNESNN